MQLIIFSFFKKSKPFKNERRRPRETEYGAKFAYTRANVNNEKKKSFEFADVSTIAFICK